MSPKKTSPKTKRRKLAPKTSEIGPGANIGSPTPADDAVPEIEMHRRMTTHGFDRGHSQRAQRNRPAGAKNVRSVKSDGGKGRRGGDPH